MSTFKCKMCGGTMDIPENATVFVCEYCGTQQTLPKLSDDRRANLYDRANHFRRNNEFDKAMGIFEQILNDDPSDAEAYWSIVLCRYGIEYVEDPGTHKRVPTVNRAQFTSVFDDADYKSALQYADGSQRGIYEDEARTINEIQKGILAISQKEEPFDVFICYKETDNNGRRTPDSVLATELYHELTREGFKVFFSRITLEDKLGIAYEPYIFAALNSSKVMVALGTKPEYFNAVWVKNEWSRYLALIKNGARKILIPAYRDMDPYDLPEEFAHLQAQDMSKLGFMQDLIRGIKKIVEAEAPRENVVVQQNVGYTGNIGALLKRGNMALEDSEWAKADEFFEEVLNQDAECAEAYLGKLMAELRVRKQADLRNQRESFDGNGNYQKTIRFARAELKTALVEDIKFIKERNENARLESIYSQMVKFFDSAKTEAECKASAAELKEIAHYKDSAALAQKYLDKAEACRKDAIYNDAKAAATKNTIKDCETAIQKFKTISGWKDADEQIALCNQKIDELKRKAEANKKAAAQRAKKAKKIAAICAAAVVVIVAAALLTTKVIIPNAKYNDAVELIDAGQYEDAIAAFEAMDGYKDSAKQIEACEIGIIDKRYQDAIVAINEGDYICAYEALTALDGYKDSAEKANSIYDKYQIQCKIEVAQQVEVGDYVFFGRYEQDNDTTNGKEEIEWLVLERQENRLFLISRYSLDCKYYNTSRKSVTWETCALREWLNNEFFHAAFTEEEQLIIPTVTVEASKNPNYDTKLGNATQDKVFLLSTIEVEQYFTSSNARKCAPTANACATGALKLATNGCYWWWLRTSGKAQDYVSVVTYEGYPSKGGIEVNYSGPVRPAMWIELG